MTYRRYEAEKRLNQETLQLIDRVNDIIEEFNGYSMSVRQVYYQMVARGFTGGENSGKMYNRIQGVINTGRMQGLISWDAIEDRGRNLRGLNTFESVDQILKAARNEYRIDLWKDQQWRPEVWIEKDALSGVISGICNRLRVNFFASKGYNSQSEQWRAGRRLAGYVQKGQRPIIFHLGDHDPSGIDMTRDNQERLSLFAGVPIIVQRLALNMSQVEEFNPPPNPAKITDSRSSDYIERYGDESWELDALSPRYIETLIEQAVLKIRDPDVWNMSLANENHDLEKFDIMLEQMK